MYVAVVLLLTKHPLPCILSLPLSGYHPDMKLTGVMLTINSERRLPVFLPSVIDIVDELVIVVDDASQDDTYEVAKSYTKYVYKTQHKGALEFHLKEILSYCDGDWILLIDDDESLIGWDKTRLTAMMSDKNITHCYFPRKWLIPPGDRFISTWPWFPDYQARLFRNLPGIFEFPDLIHENLRVAGYAHYLPDHIILHHDLCFTSRQERESKVARYESLRPGHSCREYYLYEDQIYETEELNLEQHSSGRVALSNDVVGLGSDGFISTLKCPGVMRHNLKYPVELKISNKMDGTMYPTQQFISRTDTFISYHWISKDRESMNLWDNERFELPAPLEPGDSHDAIIVVTPPREEGHYALQFDIVEEHKYWYSHKYLEETFPYVEVDVVAGASSG